VGVAVSQLVHDLPEGLAEWIAGIGGGEITRLHRHVARREAWVVDVSRPDGSVLEGFLRLQRDEGGVDPRRLERETRIIEALGRTDVPVPAVYGWNPGLRATLFQRDPGRSDLDRVDDPARQRAVMEDFMRVVARMHTLDLDALGLDDVMQYRPKTARECALAEVDLIAAQWRSFLDGYADPLTVYGLDWLDRFAPDSVARVSLVQGDTGPVNFMFQDRRVSAVIDWELGHYGDPLEDLGNIVVREFWNPCGGLTGLFELYERESGIAYDRFRTQYYAVHQNVRGMIPIHYVSENAHPQESLAWYLCYRYVGDRSTCEMLAAAMEVAIEPPDLPTDDGERDVLADAAVHAQQHDVEPKLDDPFAASRARDVRTLVRCIDRRRRHGPQLAADELDDIGELLGRRPTDLPEGRRALCEAISDRRLADDRVIRLLARKGHRDEWLFAPAVELYPERRWSTLD
jgi:aminoglycoside phosphotransferase (APT) family kinase protein